MPPRPNIKNKPRFLIVNADDFGMTVGISKGIIRLYSKKVVTSTSLMLDMPGTAYAASFAKTHEDFCVGLHGQIDPKVVGDQNPIDAYIDQLEGQLRVFRKLISRMPSHFDLHGVPTTTLHMALAAHIFAKKYNFYYRGMGNMRVINDFYGMKGGKLRTENISFNFLKLLISALKSGITVLVCHPGITSNKLADPYRRQRNAEFLLLTSKKFYSLIREEEIKLVNFYSKEVKKLHDS